MKRFLIFVCLVMAVSGCHLPAVPTTEMLSDAETTFDQRLFAKGGKALVLLQATNDMPPYADMMNRVVFKNKRSGAAFVLISRNMRTLMIPAGTYEMTEFGLFSAGSLRSELDFSRDYKASFTVESGDVVYLGTIKTHAVLGERRLNLYGPAEQRVRATSELRDDFKQLPANYTDWVAFYAGKPVETKLMSWKRTVY